MTAGGMFRLIVGTGVHLQAAVFLGFTAPAAYTSPEAAVLTKLFVRLLADALNEVAYPASLAGVLPPMQARKHASIKLARRA